MYDYELTDERALFLLHEFSKFDKEALGLMAELQKAKDFGDKDQLICKIHYYIKKHTRNE